MRAIDAILFLPYLMAVYGYALRRKKSFGEEVKGKKYFIWALSAKIFGAVFAGLLYYYYYGGGDTIEYFNGVHALQQALWHSPSMAVKLLFTDAGHYTIENYPYTSQFYMFRNAETFFVVKVMFLLSIPGMGSYLATSFLLAYVCFSASWSFYQVLVRRYPALEQQLAWAIFFIPSVVFWGSGLFKDTIMFIGMMVCITAFMKTFFFKEDRFKSVVYFIIAAAVMYHIRSFFVLIMIALMIMWYFMSIRDRFKSSFIRAAMAPLLIGISVLFIGLMFSQISSTNEEFSEDIIKTKLEGFHQWHGALGGDGASYYSIGEVEYTTTGLIRKIPICVFITLFRPFLWEASNPIILLSAMESLFFLMFTLFVLFKIGLHRFAFQFIGRSDVMFLLLFTIFFAFVTGLTALNFGALSRYKIPILPLYLTALFIMRYQLQPVKIKNASKELPSGTGTATAGTLPAPA